jgi:hypothetical protein
VLEAMSSSPGNRSWGGHWGRHAGGVTGDKGGGPRNKVVVESSASLALAGGCAAYAGVAQLQ